MHFNINNSQLLSGARYEVMGSGELCRLEMKPDDVHSIEQDAIVSSYMQHHRAFIEKVGGYPYFTARVSYG